LSKIIPDISKFNYYKKCPKCGSAEIVFAEHLMSKYIKQYKVMPTGEIDMKHCKTGSFSMKPAYSYGCINCDWVDFGATTWNKERNIK
jgi:hypothetical protein